eukprot:8029516-Pyramimonas_sp.AAC.1
MDAVVAQWTSLRAYVVVDDITLAVCGKLRDVEFAAFGATRDLCRRLEAPGLKVSLTKGNIVSSDE